MKMNFKKLLFLGLISILSMSSCSEETNKTEEPSIVGSWMIETVDGEELPEAEKMAYMILTQDGNVEQGTDGVCELGGDNTIKGKWKLTNDDKTLVIENEDGTTSTYTEVKYSENDLSIMHDVTPVTFRRKK